MESAFFSVLAPLVPELKQEFGLSKQTVGVLVGTYVFGMLVMIIPTGPLVRRIGARDAVVLGTLLLAVATLAFGLSRAERALITFRFIQGVGGSILWTGVMAWRLETASSDRRGRVIGTVLAATFLGSSLGPMIGAVAVALGFTLTFVIISLIGFLIAGAVLRAPASRRPEKQRGAVAPRGRLSRIGVAAIGILFATSMASGARFVLVPLQLAQQRVSGAEIGGIFTASAVLAALGAFATGRVVDRRGGGRVLTFGVAITIGSLVAFTMASGVAITAALTICVGLGYQVILGAGNLVVADESAHVGLDYATAFVYMNLAWTGGFLCGNLFAPWISQRTSDRVAWAALTTAVLVAGLAAVVAWASSPGSGRAYRAEV